MRYEITQIGRRFYVVDTQTNSPVGITRTLGRTRYSLNRGQAEALAQMCNHINSLEA